MSTPRGFRDRSDDSLLTLVGEVPELVRNLVVAEIDSAKKWAKKTGKDAGMGGAWFLVALFFLFWSIPALGAFTIIGLSSWMPAWLASLIVFVIGIVLVAVFALLGLLRFKKLSRSENPAKAIKVDARIVKEVADEF
ncbi:MAG: phage holin family protein [Microbacterium hominis]|jgi:fatty acid desaturase|uniref:phage holin family protein n=1 Tax=Microbacterium aurum TaxID=36805 RepID=UPI00248ECD66|nr:phage holin family protein [Microbacterium aurum]MBZ6372018.1 phage holin family protein [Microbacterium hominis]